MSDGFDMQTVPTYPDLAGKVAAVTGGSRGIGAATCRMLGANGVRVAVAARSRQGVEEMLATLKRDGVEAMGFTGDAGRLGDMQRFEAEVHRTLGPPNILLPFAGGFTAFTHVSEVSEQEWRTVIDDNLTSTFLTVKAFVAGFMERRSGSIVTMASCAGRNLDRLVTASYAAAKAGVVMFTRHIAHELGPLGIRANVIAPATVASERVLRIMDDEALERVAAMSPLGRLGTPEDCALATLFLVSESAGWLTGITVDVAGGRMML